MKKTINSLLIMFLFFACNNSGNCSSAYFKQQNCNIVVTDNIRKSTHWATPNLRLKGIDLTTGRKVFYKSIAREWGPLSDYINIGDTVVKNEGEAIMYVYKKDSIVIDDLTKICNPDFDWEKDEYTFISRDTIN